MPNAVPSPLPCPGSSPEQRPGQQQGLVNLSWSTEQMFRNKPSFLGGTEVVVWGFFCSNEDLARGSEWRSGQGKDTALGRSLCPTTQSIGVTRNSPLPAPAGSSQSCRQILADYSKHSNACPAWTRLSGRSSLRFHVTKKPCGE